MKSNEKIQSFRCDLEEFKRRSKELMEAIDDLDPAQLDNGLKALSLSYLSMDGSAGEICEASVVMTMVTRRVLQQEMHITLLPLKNRVCDII